MSLVQKVEIRDVEQATIQEPLSFWNKVVLTVAQLTQNYNYKTAPDTALGPWRLGVYL